MDISVFYEKNWFQLNDLDKIEKLQQLENEMAVFQKRDNRVIAVTVDSEFCADNAEAQYNFFKPENIFVRNFSNGFKAALSTIHEGIHAMYDDAFNGKIDTVLAYGKVNLKDLVRERINKNIIHNHFCHKTGDCRILFNLCYIEEKIAHFDSKCFLLDMIRSYVNSEPQDRKNNAFYRQLYDFYEKIFVEELNRIIYLNEIKAKTKIDYDEEIKIINYSDFEDKKEKITKPAVLYGDSLIHSHVSSQLQICKNIYAPAMSSKKEVNVQKFQTNYRAYFK